MILVLLLACPPHAEPNTAPAADAAAQAAAARVPDPERGGPTLHPGQPPLPPFTGVSRSTATYVGAEPCAACHAATARRWARSHHAGALLTLERAQHAHDPECLPCHVTGLGHPGGANASTVPLQGVQCEACHGPGSDHIAAPTARYGALPRDASACVACHTVAQSPDFAFAPYWRRVAHAGD